MDGDVISKALDGLDATLANLGQPAAPAYTAAEGLTDPDGTELAQLLASIVELLGRGGLAGVERPARLWLLLARALGLVIEHLCAADAKVTRPCAALLRQLVFNTIPDCLEAVGCSQFDQAPLLLSAVYFGLRCGQLLLRSASGNPKERLAVIQAALPSIAVLAEHQGGSDCDEGDVVALLLVWYNVMAKTVDDEPVRSLLCADPSLAAATIHTATLALRRIHAAMLNSWDATKPGCNKHGEPTVQSTLEQVLTLLAPRYLLLVAKLDSLLALVEDAVGDRLVLRQALEQANTARLAGVGWWIQQEQSNARAGKPTTDPFIWLFLANHFLDGMQMLGGRLDACTGTDPAVGLMLASFLEVVQQMLVHWSAMGQWGFGEDSTEKDAVALSEQMVVLAGLLEQQARQTARQVQLLQRAGCCVSPAAQRYFSEPVLLEAARGLYSILSGDKSANSVVMTTARLHVAKLERQVRCLPKPEVELNWSWLQRASRFKVQPSNPASAATAAAAKHLREVKLRRDLQGKQQGMGMELKASAATAERAAAAEAAAAQLLREIEQEEKASLEKASKKDKQKSKKQQKRRQEEEMREAGPVPCQAQQQRTGVQQQQQREQQQGASPSVSTASPCRLPLSPANRLARPPSSPAVAPPLRAVDCGQQRSNPVVSSISCSPGAEAACFNPITEVPAGRPAKNAGQQAAAHYCPSMHNTVPSSASGIGAGPRNSGTTITAAAANPGVGGGSEEAELSELFGMLGIPYSAASPLSAPPTSALSAQRTKQLQQSAQVEGKLAAASTALLPAASDDDGCVVCMLTDPDAVLVPCGHMILCWGCAANMYGPAGLQRCCPMCRAQVAEFVRVRAR